MIIIIERVRTSEYRNKKYLALIQSSVTINDVIPSEIYLSFYE